jgi:hypothetical protein
MLMLGWSLTFLFDLVWVTSNIIDVAQLTYLTIFINTIFPYNLQKGLEGFSIFFLPFLPSILSPIGNEETNFLYTPCKFQLNNYDSAFVKNGGISTTLLIVAGCIYGIFESTLRLT